MGVLAALVAMVWAAAGISVAINMTEKQDTVKGAVLMLLGQIFVISLALLPIVFGVVNAS